MDPHGRQDSRSDVRRKKLQPPYNPNWDVSDSKGSPNKEPLGVFRSTGLLPRRDFLGVMEFSFKPVLRPPRFVSSSNAALALFRLRLKIRRESPGRPLGLHALQRLHSSHIADDVTWIVVGLSVYGTMFLLFLGWEPSEPRPLTPWLHRDLLLCHAH